MGGEVRGWRARRGVLAVTFTTVAAFLALGAGAAAHPGHSAPEPNGDPAPTIAGITSCGDGVDRVLFLSQTVGGSCNHPTVSAAVSQGFGVDLATDAAWSALTTAQFAEYRALAMADYYCSGGTEQVAAAEATVATWTPAVTGNVIVIGTDEAFHRPKEVLHDQGIAFATSDPAKTGAYISLSCYYHYFEPADAPTPVEVLSGFGTFNALRTDAISDDDCFNDAHIVATHPALDGLTDADLSNWGCSVHEAFSSWPISFEVLAIAENIGTDFFTAPDGTSGAPYILARGVEVISDVRLEPVSSTRPVGDVQRLTATVKVDGVPVAGTDVTFTAIDGPNAGQQGVAPTNAAGEAVFDATSAATGTDTYEATFVDDRDRTQRSNRVTITWTDGSTAEPEGPHGDPTCGDGVDNDLDTLVDDADPDCAPPVEGCVEDGLSLLAPSGIASSVVHEAVEPVAGSLSPDLEGVVHDVNCSVVVPVEALVDELLVAPAASPLLR